MKIAVDFDGTVVDHRYPEIGKDVPHAVETLKYLISRGHKIILNTMRSEQFLFEAVKWFQERDIKLYGIGFDPDQHVWTNSSKCYAEIYIDDLAFGCPTILVPGFNSVCVDWLEVKTFFEGLDDV